MTSVKQAAGKILRYVLATKNKKIVSSKFRPMREINNLGREYHLDIFSNDFTNDSIRMSLLDLAIDEIKTKGTKGSVAELGVYQGHFASVLNGALPEHRLLLFDTFEGFDNSEEKFDQSNFGLTHDRDFSDTSLEAVMERMPFPEQCIPRKGLFPDTAVGLEDEEYCFVSIDTDLYQPIKSGLEYFYDRLAPGGFIFVHDYNNSAFPGARQAVNEFSSERNIPFVPVCDWFGTAIFRK